MAGQALDLNDAASNGELIGSFMEITSASKEEAVFFLESHKWDLDAVVSTFLDNNTTTTIIQPNPQVSSAIPRSPSESQSSDYSPSRSRSRSRSLPPADAEPLAPRVRYSLRSKGKKPGEGGSGAGRGYDTLISLRYGIFEVVGSWRKARGERGEEEEEEDEEEEREERGSGRESTWRHIINFW